MAIEDILQRVTDMVTPLCEELELDIYDIDLRQSSSEALMRIMLERKDVQGPGTGITLAELTKVTKQMNYLLDIEDFIPFRYRLEISSPGVERVLTKPLHWEKNVGETVRVVLREPTPDGQIVLMGKLDSCDPHSAEIVCEDNVRRRAYFDVVKKAQTVYDFTADSLKPKKQKP